MRMLFLLITIFLTSANAFQASLPRFVGPKTAQLGRATPIKVIMTDEEVSAILQSATECAEGECSIEDVDELLMELKQQEKVLEERLEMIMNMINHLQHVNEKEERQTDEVRAFVRDMLRVFAHDKNPGFNAAGFSGDVFGKTAYDALPPKKWKPGTVE